MTTEPEGFTDPLAGIGAIEDQVRNGAASDSGTTDDTTTPGAETLPPTPSTGTGGAPDDQGGTAVSIDTVSDEDLEHEVAERQRRKARAEKARAQQRKKDEKAFAEFLAERGYKVKPAKKGKGKKKDKAKKGNGKKGGDSLLFTLGSGQSYRRIAHVPPYATEAVVDNGPDSWAVFRDPDNLDFVYARGPGEGDAAKVVMATRSFYDGNHTTLVGMVAPAPKTLAGKAVGWLRAKPGASTPAATS